MISTLKSLLESRGKQPDPLKPIQLSHFYMAHEISENQAGLNITFEENDWKRYATMTFTGFIKSAVQGQNPENGSPLSKRLAL